MSDLKKALDSLREAENDIERLKALSNQFRTCFVLVAAPPSQTLPPNGGIEIKDFLEEQKSRFENGTLEDAIMWIDVCQSHLAFFSRMARELSKEKVKINVSEKVTHELEDQANYRAKKAAKSNGKIHVDKDGDEVKNPVSAGIDPIDKKTYKAIKQIQKAMGTTFEIARDMVLGMQLK